MYHIKDVVIPVSDPGKLETAINEISGRVISICQHPQFPDNWRIFWIENEDGLGKAIYRCWAD